MTFLAIVGAVLITGVLLYFTVALIYLTFFYFAMGEVHLADAGIAAIAYIAIGAAWYVWWGLVAIHFSIGIS